MIGCMSAISTASVIERTQLFGLIIASRTICATTYAAYSQRGHTVSDMRQVRGGFQPRIATLNGVANGKPRPAPAKGGENGQSSGHKPDRIDSRSAVSDLVPHSLARSGRRNRNKVSGCGVARAAGGSLSGSKPQPRQAAA